MLGRIAKTLEVVDQLKQIPVEERRWLLEECKTLVQRYYHSARKSAEAGGPHQAFWHMRMQTLNIAWNLLSSINIDP